MAVLIVDPPEVVSRALADTLDTAGLPYRMLPERRTEVVTHSSGAPDAEDMRTGTQQVRSAPRDGDSLLWFVRDGHGNEARDDGELIQAMLDAGISRVIAVTPLRASRQPEESPQLAGLLARSKDFPRGALAVATAPVYGPGDELVSRLLIMMRSLPVVPLLASGEREYQPIWHEDLAGALVALLRDGASASTVRVAGPEVVTQQTLYDRIAPLIDRHPARLAVPEFLTRLGLTLIDAASGTDTAAGEGEWVVDADTAILPPGHNELERLLGRPPVVIAEGLRRLVTELPEQLPGTGVGTLQVKHFWADLRAPGLHPATVLDLIRSRFSEIMPVPIGVEPGAPETRLDVGEAVTIHLPGRGHVQVRVEAADSSHVVLSTLRGHTLAGVVRFLAAPAAGGVRVEVMTADKPATPIDWLALTLGGARLQNANWRMVVGRIAALLGVGGAEVHSHVRNATDAEVEHLSTWVRRLVDERLDGPPGSV